MQTTRQQLLFLNKEIIMKFWQCDIPSWELGINKILAKAWYKNGRKPDISFSIAETYTAGYGKMDEHGFFEFPLDVDQETQEIIN